MPFLAFAAWLAVFPEAFATERTVVVVNDVTDPSSLDPHREFDASSENIVNQIFDCLVRFSEEGAVLPALAESWKRIDEKTFEFRLRSGVRFHNGEVFDAEAVRFSLTRQLDPKRPAPNAGLLGMLEGAEVIDSRTVRIKTSRIDESLLIRLLMLVRILPPRYLKEVGDEGFARNPIGTGPFVFVRWEKGDRIELAANPDYRIPEPPKIERLVFRFLARDKQLGEFLAGGVDLLTDLSGLDTGRVSRNPRTRVVKAMEVSALTLMFNSRKEPFSDERVREAVLAAIDRKELIRYGAKGNAVALRGFTVPGEAGYDPRIESPAFDISRAKRLLREAGVKEGREIRIQSREEVKDFCRVLALQLREVGLLPTCYFVSQERQFVELALPKQKDPDAVWDGDLVLAHRVNPTLHVYFPYSIVLHSKSVFGLVQEPELDALLERMASSVDPSEQVKLASRLEEAVVRGSWVASVVQMIRPYGVSSRVRYKPFLSGMLDFRGIEVVGNQAASYRTTRR